VSKTQDVNKTHQLVRSSMGNYSGLMLYL